MPKIRIGKTAKDHNSGAHSNRFKNRAARVSWYMNRDAFPKTACNGKKNRHRYTGKGNKTVML